MSPTDRLAMFTRPMRLLFALALMFALLLALAPSHTYAATTTVISDQASCEAFGARWDSNINSCEVDQAITIQAGDTLIFQIPADLSSVTNNGTLTNATGHFISTGSITNNVGATINSVAGAFRTYGVSVNYGTINGSFEISRPFTNASTGQMNVQGELFLADVLTNQGTITIACGTSVSAIYDGQIVGNPAQYADCTGPTVTVNQAAWQPDPGHISPINFTAVFDENVSGFTASDVVLSGTAGATSAVVSGSGSTYTIAVSGMTGDGTVIVSIPAGAAQDAAGNPSAASASTDNSVSFTRTTVISDQASCEAFGSDWHTNPTYCKVYRDITIRAGDTLIFQISADLRGVTNNGTLTNAYRSFISPTSIINNAGATINGGAGGFRTNGASVNYGTINGSFQIFGPFTNASTGLMNVQGELYLADVLTNQGTITIACGSSIKISNGQIAGTPPQYADCTGPTVAVNQAAWQPDPGHISPINFTAVFDENVSGFTASDVALSGTAGATSAVVSGSGSTYTIAVSGMTGDGTVIVSIPAGAAQDAAGNPSAASASTDNSVSFTRTTVISDQASCEAFGSDWHTNPTYCKVYRDITIRAGDTLIFQISADLRGVTNNGTLTNAYRSFISPTSIINNAGATINGGAGGFRTNGASVNYGTINGSFQIFGPFTNASTGLMNVQGELYLADVLTNQGTITIPCGSSIRISGGQIAGTPPQYADCTGPTVTINQAAGQSDPAGSGPINFTAVFDENVSGFTASDVALSGTAGATSAVVSGSGSTYTIAVSGMTGYGTVIVAIPAGAVQDAAGNPSSAATSTDNTVLYMQSTTTISFTSSANPARLGEPITFRATVTAASGTTPNGTVTFLSGTTALGTGTLVDGVASFTTSSLPVGNSAITARFEGTPSYYASVSAAGTQVVRAGSSTTLTLSASTSIFGEPITLTATVSAATSPSGSVTFYDGATSLGTKALRSGAASVTVSTLAAGQHTLTAVYGGSPQLDGSVSPALSHTVTPAQTTTGLTVAPSSSVLGQTITLTATVSVVAPGGGKPAGTVNFYNGTTLLGSKTLGANGVAIYSTSALAVGNHSLRAEYSGSANHSASASAPTAQVVAAAGTTTTLATSATTVVNGQKITLTATVAAVAPGKGTPSGSIVFRDGTTELGSVSLSNSRATKQVTLALGSHSLVAEYVPADGSFSASSGTASATVNPASTSVTLTTSGTPATFGRNVTFTATVKVTTPGVGIPTGTVVFRDGEIVLAEVSLVNGKATFATTTLARGTHPITASYSGDAGNTGSVSSIVAQVVN